MNYGNEMRRRGKAQQQHLFRYFRHTIHLGAKDGKHETMEITSSVLKGAGACMVFTLEPDLWQTRWPWRLRSGPGKHTYLVADLRGNTDSRNRNLLR